MTATAQVWHSWLAAAGGFLSTPRQTGGEAGATTRLSADVVETPNTFSGIPKPERLAEWAEQAPDDFRFDVIAFGGLTLHQRRPGDSGPIGRRSWQDVSVIPPDVLFDDFAQALAPLAEAWQARLCAAAIPVVVRGW